jgi:3-hydroxyisobutyrate dehydrogenase-like beta-hydroxyacid dehydrogenase
LEFFKYIRRLLPKDLRNALLTAEAAKVPLLLTSLVQQMLITLMTRGSGDLDHSALFTLLDEMAPQTAVQI